MAVELITTGQKDTNDYVGELINCGHEQLDDGIKNDVVAVWSFFCNEELVLRGLKTFTEQYFRFNQEKPGTLRQFFDDWGSKNHFNAPANDDLPPEVQTSRDFHYPDHTPLLCGELTADLFNNVLLKNGYLSADLGAGPKHGKWAHSIQLFLLEEARKEGLLKLNARTVCQFVQTISQIKGQFDSLSLWSLLFDSFDAALFTCPDSITAVLSSKWDNSEAATLLASKLSSFEEKFNKAASAEKSYQSYANTKYLTRLNEASYIQYKDKCSLLWFTPKERQEEKQLTSTKDAQASCPNL
ncbi:LirA/MavJ family T4SS effector [Legionella waltersii]|uniref:Helicase n=1 Tax=Legionella waltersii TaxID=66969 RepID=A0A0W1A5T3_9GAMM|nr:LirA/MavJ family T4SS effector [Legionella waltersii]KTD76600.1 helicase [Legionella waltersii]SNU94585.1 helicase [Legionella waltersii]